MKKDNNKMKKIVEILLAVSMATVVMLLGIYYMPLQFIIFLYAIPFVVIGIKHEINTSIIGMILSTFIIGLLTDKLSGLFILITFLPLNIALVYTIKSRKKPSEIMAISTVVLIISFFIIMSIMGDITGVSIINQIEEFLNHTLNTQLELLEDMDLSSYEMFKLKDTMEDKLKEVLLIIPSTIMIFSLIMTYINYIVSVLILRKLGYGIVHIPRFSRFKLPNNILLGVGIMFLGTFILKVFNVLNYRTIFANITLLTSFTFFLQGLAVVDHKLKKKNRNWFLRLLILLFFTILIPVGGIITFIGILDVIFDFRGIRKAI
ncbi:MAG: DUF2232 domain-containing protein [Tissierellia bacterium]|nr:DUF2232 domain-containing protein [Tissierellia bacterium]